MQYIPEDLTGFLQVKGSIGTVATMLTSFFLIWFVVSFVLYQICLVAYRLFFHPLARFPGPKLAATTFWWECIQDLFAGQGGEYMNQVEAMHDKYGT